MKMKTFRIGCIALVLLTAQAQEHRPGLMARVISADGTNQTVMLNGVGCSASICSRVVIRGKSESGVPLRTRLDSIASIKETTEKDALFVMKDGTEKRLAFVADFRVLYLSNRSGGEEKVDLTRIQSLEFVDPGK
jgi:hypothetical protein